MGLFGATAGDGIVVRWGVTLCAEFARFFVFGSSSLSHRQISASTGVSKKTRSASTSVELRSPAEGASRGKEVSPGVDGELLIGH